MLISVAVLILLGLFLGQVMKRLHLPSLVGYLLTGILLGPSVLNVLSSQFLALSADFRELALIVILTRAGLSLDIDELKKVGRPALLMCFCAGGCRNWGDCSFGTSASWLFYFRSFAVGKYCCSGVACCCGSKDAKADSGGLWSRKAYSSDYLGRSICR